MLTPLIVLVVSASASTGSARASFSFPKGDVVAHVVFDGSGTATGYATTTQFSWHMVYDIDVTSLKRDPPTGRETQSGWLTMDDSSAGWDAKASTLSGTNTGSGCQNTLTRDPTEPAADYQPSVHGPIQKETAKIALTALAVLHSSGPACGSGFSHGCDTYDARYGYPTNDYIIADFPLNLDQPDETGTVPVSTSHSWDCSKTFPGQTPATGTIQWKGTITVGGGCTVSAMRSLASSTPAAATSPRRLLAKPPHNPHRLPKPGYGYASYHFGYDLPRLLCWSTTQAERRLTRHLPTYFPIGGAKANPVPGQRWDLNEVAGLNMGVVGVHAPVVVYATAADGFSLESLPSHPEGAYRLILFQFVRHGRVLVLQVSAWGPVSYASLFGPFNAILTKQLWQQLANNINTGYPEHPP